MFHSGHFSAQNERCNVTVIVTTMKSLGQHPSGHEADPHGSHCWSIQVLATMTEFFHKLKGTYLAGG